MLVNPDLTVNCAGGYLIQLLPAAGEDTITKVEQSISGIESVTQMMSRGMGVFDIAKNVLSKFNLELLDESEPIYKCNCSRERMERMLRSIGKDELTKLAGEQEVTKVCCHFCNKEYDFTSDELKTIAQNLK